MSKPIVTIGIPTGDYFTIVRPTAIDMMKMIAHTMNNGVCEKVFVESAASPSTERNRNSLVGQMDESSEFLLQIDADMTFPPDTLERMLKTYERIYEIEKKPFVLAGFGCMGAPPFFPAMFSAVNKNEQGGFDPVHEDRLTGDMYDGWVPIIDVPNDIFKVDAIGSYGFLIPFELFSVFKGYGGWFNHHMEMDAETPGKYLEIRHDIAFSMRVRESGHSIWVDPSIEFGHIRPRPVKKAVWNQHVAHPQFDAATFSREQFRARHLSTAFGWQLRHAESDGLAPEAEKQLPINRE